jgi:hypothetical protein
LYDCQTPKVVITRLSICMEGLEALAILSFVFCFFISEQDSETEDASIRLRFSALIFESGGGKLSQLSSYIDADGITDEHLKILLAT